MRKVRRKKNNSQTMLLGEYSVRTRKTPQQHKSTYTIDTRHSHRGSESGPASSHLIPQPLIRRWSDPLDQASGSKRTEANGRGGGGGGGGNVCMSVGWGRNARASNCIAHPGVWRAVQRESLTRQGSKAGKIRVRTRRESDHLRWEPKRKKYNIQH